MLDRDKLTELHNNVTHLHKMTSLAASGTGAINFEDILEVVISVLGLIKNNFSTMHMEFRRSILEKPETTDDKKDVLSSEPKHPDTPQREGLAENIIQTVKGNPPPKEEGPKPTDLTINKK